MVLHLKVWESRTSPGLPNTRYGLLGDMTLSSERLDSAVVSRMINLRNNDLKRQGRPAAFFGCRDEGKRYVCLAQVGPTETDTKELTRGGAAR